MIIAFRHTSFAAGTTKALLALLFFFCGPSLDAADLEKATREQIDKDMQDEIAKQSLVGAALGIIVDGEIAYLKGYGLEDRENKIPVTRKTLFRWASISKSLTSVAAMQLYEKKLLKLHNDVRSYVPEFPDKKTLVTTRDLLCHQGGIVHYTNGKVIKTKRQYGTPTPFESVILALDTFKDSPLVNQPGEKFSYTTHGYILLSAVIERAGGEKFAGQVEKRISRPLGMTTLQPDYQWKKIPHRAVGYRKLLGRVVPSSNTDVSWKLGGGGFISNIDDLAAFARGLINGRLVRPGTEKLMWTPRKLKNSRATTYGFGFNISGEGKDLQVAHSGAQEKTRTRMVIFPAKKLGVVVMSNSEHCNSKNLARAAIRSITRVLENKPVKTSRLPAHRKSGLALQGHPRRAASSQ
ncbi:MAG: serine hydrolase domain-containing protein [Planctomycetota bacterium]|nr:serine hydrolase domain-containing protein [Planctomycetota bacterium]